MQEDIIKELKNHLPTSMIQYVDEVEELIVRREYREAYLKMYEIRNNPSWSPTSKYLQLMEKFWWNYAN